MIALSYNSRSMVAEAGELMLLSLSTKAIDASSNPLLSPFSSIYGGFPRSKEARVKEASLSFPFSSESIILYSPSLK